MSFGPFVNLLTEILLLNLNFKSFYLYQFNDLNVNAFDRIHCIALSHYSNVINHFDDLNDLT